MKSTSPLFPTTLILMLLCAPRVYSQANPDSTGRNPVKAVAAEIAGDLWHVASAPLRMSGKSSLNLFFFTALNAGFIYGVDGPADEEFAMEGTQTYVQPAKALVRAGEVYDRLGTKKVALGLSGLFLTGGLIAGDQKMLETSRLMLESLFISTAITHISKRAIGRSRPYTEKGPHTYTPFHFFSNSEHGIRAMPSGHSSSAWAMMTVVAKQYSTWWIRYPAYAMAASVSLQRMDDRQHWLSDVVVGGAIGYWVSSTLAGHFQSRNGISIAPFVSGEQAGIAIRF